MMQVIEKYHDYQPTQYYIDETKLSPDNPVDDDILRALEAGKDEPEVHVRVDASNWESNPRFKPDVFGEPNISECAKINGVGQVVRKVIWLTIDFDA